jgi:hypothetical protein
VVDVGLARRKGPLPVATEGDPTGQINGWKTFLNALTIHYGDRIEAAS